MIKRTTNERLISPPMLGLFGVMLALALYGLRPDLAVMSRTLMLQKPSDLSIAYLETWLRIQPDSPYMLESVTRQYLGLGRWDDATRAADELTTLGDPATYGAGIRLQLEALTRKAWDLPESDPNRAALLGQATRLIDRRMAEYPDMDAITLEYLADLARSLDAQALNLQLYARLAERDPSRATFWFAELGRTALSFGQYERAADAYFQAQAHSESLIDRRDSFMAALRALQSGNLVAQACDRAEQHLGDLGDDPIVLRLLIQLARQAERYDLVQRYGRELARRIAFAPRYLDGARGALLAGWQAPATLARVAATSTAPTGLAQLPANRQPTTASDYELLYQAFIESGLLLDAQELVQRALAKGLDRHAWLLRLAQVAEWNRQPRLALETWTLLAHEFNDSTAWSRLLRLAPQMNADRLYLQALLNDVRLHPDDLSLIRQVVGAYETVGDPEGGIVFLQKHPTQQHHREILALLATTAERAGHDDLALRSWQKLNSQYGPNPSYALHIASLQYAAMRPEQALAALREARAAANQGPLAKDFWKTYVGLARLLGEPADVNQGFQGQIAHAPLDDADTDELLYFYYGNPMDRARVAEAAFRRTQSMPYLQQALEAYSAAHAWRRVANLLQGLSAEQVQALQQDPALLESRSTYWLAIGDVPAGLQDLQRAYQLAPAAPQAGISYLWALLSFGSRDDVQRLARTLAQSHGNEPAYAGVLAAAALSLGQPRQAIAYMDLQGVPARRDPFWLMSYADARELLGQPDLAWRIRREAWRLMAVQRGRTADTLDRQAARVSLGQIYRNGDVSLTLMLRLLQSGAPDEYQQAIAQSILGDVPGLPPLADETDRRAPADVRTARRRTEAAVQALALGWAISGEHHDLARAWLGNRYVKGIAKPDAARLSIALLDDDRNTLDQVLQRNAASLDASARVQALERLGRTPEAQTVAFEALDQAPDNQSIYETFQDTVLRDRPAATVGVEQARLDSLETTTETLSAGIKLTDSLDLTLRHIERQNRSRNESVLPWVPSRDQSTELSFRKKSGTDLRYLLDLGWRDALTQFGTGQIGVEWTADEKTAVLLQAGVNRYTDVSELLSVAGARDFVAAEANWDSQRDWFAGGRVELARFHVQSGPRVGNGVGYTGTLGYHLRMDDPALYVRALVSQWRYSLHAGEIAELAPLSPNAMAPQASALLPDRTLQYGLALGIGTEIQDQYQRGWRPFLELSWIHDRVQGWGLGVRGGIGGSVLGRDRLGVYVSHEAARQGDSQPSTRVGLFYRFFY